VWAHLENADDKIVFDRFHIMGYLNKAVGSVRKQENRALVTQGDKTLSGSKYLWFYGAENLPSKHEGRFAALRSADLKTGRAWAIMDSLRHFLEYIVRGWALRHWNKWYFWATHSRLAPITDAARTLKGYEPVSRYFAHPITNAGAEGPIHACKQSEIPPVDTATANTSKPLSTSTLADWPLTPNPLNTRKRLSFQSVGKRNTSESQFS
jgi:transposase